MIDYKEEIIDFLKVVGDKTRLEILELLQEEEKTSSDLEKSLDKAQSTISHQLKKLIDSGLVENTTIKDEESGKLINYYTIKRKGIFELLKNIGAFITKKDLFDILL